MTTDAAAALFEAAPVPMLHIGPDRSLLQINGAARQCVGAEASAGLGFVEPFSAGEHLIMGRLG